MVISAENRWQQEFKHAMKMGKLGIRGVDLLGQTSKMDFLVKIVNRFNH